MRASSLHEERLAFSISVYPELRDVSAFFPLVCSTPPHLTPEMQAASMVPNAKSKRQGNPAMPAAASMSVTSSQASAFYPAALLNYHRLSPFSCSLAFLISA